MVTRLKKIDIFLKHVSNKSFGFFIYGDLTLFLCSSSLFISTLNFLVLLEFRKLSEKAISTEMTKKGKSVAQSSTFEVIDIPPLFSDTTCNKDSEISSWEAMYNLFEEENPRELKKTATMDAASSSKHS